jgi:glutaminyl-peptide cyclotransferase
MCTWPSRRSSRSLLVGAIAAVVAAACGGDAPAAEGGASPLTVRPRTPEYVADVVRAFTHDTSAFTQGLQFVDGVLYEGTGEVGTSSIRRVRLETGEVQQRRDVPAPYFGEGIVVFGDALYQLTWKNGVAFVYDKQSFAPRREFRYDGEGWGLTSDGTQLFMSDGSATIRVLDPQTFGVLRTIAVNENGSPVRNLNELEWVKGELWANVWTTDRIARIDPQSGAVVGWINLTGLLPASLRHGNEDVLNGIAYDAATDRIFLTGKRWARLFEITLRRAN